MASTKKESKGLALARRDAFSPALSTYLRQLRRDYPGVDPEQVLRLLDPLVTRFTYSGTTGKLLLCEVGALELIRKRQAIEPKRREGWDAFRALRDALRLQIRQLHSARVWLRKLKIPGGPQACPECGATSPAERTVWCGSACPPDRADGRARKQRVLDELEDARRLLKGPLGPLRPLVPARGEGSALGWLATVDPPLRAYLASATHKDAESLAVYGVAARILSLASGQRITAQMLKGRVYRSSTS